MIVIKPETIPESPTLEDSLQSRQDSCVTIRPSTQARYSVPASTKLSFTLDEALAGGGFPGALPHGWLGRGEVAEVVPSLQIAILHDARVFGGTIDRRTNDARGQWHASGQLVLTSRFGLVSGSYGLLDGARSLPSDLVEGKDNLHLRVGGKPKRLRGTYYLIGNAHHHFGHFLLEGLSRLWAVSAAEDLVGPKLKFLVYEDRLKPFATALLDLAGIPASRIVHAPRYAVCDRLIVADPGMRTHSWITDLQAVTWTRIRDGLERGEAGLNAPRPWWSPSRFRSPPKKPAEAGRPLSKLADDVAARVRRDHREAGQRSGRIYLSRRRLRGARGLLNEQAVEDLHRKFGYEIVYPEELDTITQIAKVSGSASLSGCVGSQMYLAAFQPPGGRNIVIAPENFFLKDDMLIANTLLHQLTVVFGSINDFAKHQGWTCDLILLKNVLRKLHGQPVAV